MTQKELEYKLKGYNFSDNEIALILRAVKLSGYLSKAEILKARPALKPVRADSPRRLVAGGELPFNSTEVKNMGFNQALRDWSKALGIGETE